MQVYNENGPGEGIKLHDHDSVLNKWKDDFHDLYNMPEGLHNNFDNDFYHDIIATLPDIKRSELCNVDANDYDYNKRFVPAELDKVCDHLKLAKVVGPDMIPNEVLKHGGIRNLLLQFLNMCFVNNVIPSIWRKAIIAPIPKSASKDPCVPLNHRGISLLSCLYKLYTSLLNLRMCNHCEKHGYLVDEQNGFRPDRSCQDHIYVLSSIIRNRKSTGENTYCAFVDFKKAFDWVSRDLLLYKLVTSFGIHGRLFNSLSTIYNSSTAQVRVNGTLTDSFDVSSGVKQGDIISPVLFSMYLNDLATGIKDLNCGVDINGTKLPILLYADDIVLIAPSEEALQKMLDFIEEWCNKWRMAVNIDKTQVVHFCRPLTERTACTFSLGNESLKIVSCYKYLGVIFDEHLSFDQNASVLADSAGRALGSIRTKLKYVKECGYNTFNTLFKSGVLSIADYSAGIWGTKIFPQIEQVQYKAARYFLGVHRFAPTEALLGDMGWSTARTRHRLLILKFWNRLCNLHTSRLTRRVFDWDRLYTNKRGTWCYNVRHILHDTGCPDLFHASSACDITFAQNALVEMDLVDWDISRYKSDKLRYYNLYKYDKGTEEYTKMNINKYQRSVFAQFRCGILPLEIEVGRYRDIPLKERICQLCNNAVEDEIHFLCECPRYMDYRESLFKEAKEVDLSFMHMDIFEQFVFLMSNFQKPVMKFLNKAISRRSYYITKSAVL